MNFPNTLSELNMNRRINIKDSKFVLNEGEYKDNLKYSRNKGEILKNASISSKRDVSESKHSKEDFTSSFSQA
jgi:hypothetical protein